MPLRILVDVSPQAPNAGARIERAIARGLLEDAALNTLPIVFWTGSMYALSREQAADLLNGDGPTTVLQEIRPAVVNHTLPTAVPSTAPLVQAPTATRSGLRRRALKLALRGASVAARGVISLAPARARGDLRQSLRHARNAGMAIVRPNQYTLTIERPPEEPVRSPSEEPVDSPPEELVESNYPHLSTMVYPTRRDVLWTCSSAIEPIPLRRLAEAKLATGFRIASLCYDMHAVRTIDQLDASDLIFCTSGDVQDDLHRVAAENGRPAPRARLLPSDAAGARSAALVRDALLTLTED